MTEIDRRRFLAGAALFAASCSTPPTRGRAHCDLLLRGGTIVDGTGGPAFVGDLAVTGDRITALGDGPPPRAAMELDVSGACVAPGFIDIHTHSDRSIFQWPGAESRVRQGITTEITGNCGGSAAPRSTADDDSEPWSDVASYADAWLAADPAVNQALLVGHGTLRRAILGDADRIATDAEIAAMARTLDTALRQGAIGLSTGLEYVPGIYAPTAEITALARVVAAHDGLYASHMRSEEERLLEAVDEALTIGRDAGVRVQISHLKACGRGNWHLLTGALERIEATRAAGVDVMADAYPYTAYATTLTLLLEPWSRDGGADAIQARLRDPALRARMAAEVVPHVARDPGGFDLVVIGSVEDPAQQFCVGRSIAEIAAMWHVEPAEAFLRLLEVNGADVGYFGHGMADDDVDRVLAHPLVMVGSDGRSTAPGGRVLQRPHPRSYGTFPRVLARACHERHLFDLPTAIHKMTAMPAARARLRDRGVLRVGAFADLVVFDPERIVDRATFVDPQQYPDGILHVAVNGEFVVRDGVGTAARPGRWLSAARDDCRARLSRTLVRWDDRHRTNGSAQLRPSARAARLGSAPAPAWV